MNRARLLVVEDDEHFGYALKRFLNKDYDVWFAKNGDQALDLWKERNYDLTLLDLRMTGLSPIEVLKWSKSHHPDCSVVAVTGSGSMDLLSEILKNGADDYLLKPMEMSVLDVVIKKHLALRGQVVQEVLAGKKVLVVDDEPEIVNLFSMVLEAKGAIVTRADNGKQALDLIHADRPDLVFLDIMLPGINGVEVCRRLKSEQNLPCPVIVMFSAVLREDYRESALEAGADGYFLKPCSPHEVIEAAEEVLKSRRV